MIGGFTPFKASDPNHVYENILCCNIAWPRNADKIAKDLISKILVAEPEMRISLNDIKEHMFFKDIDWNLAERKKLDPPFVPELESNFSLENFKSDEKLEMYYNPLYKFEKQTGMATMLTNSSMDQKFKGLGNFKLKEINKMLEDF